MSKTLVSTPILEYSPLLSDADLIEIIAGGQVQQVLTAIARRRPLERGCQRRPGPVAGCSHRGGASGQSGRQDPQGDPGPHRRGSRGDRKLAPAAGAARRSVGPRHPPHRQFRRRRAARAADGARRSERRPPARISTAVCGRGWNRTAMPRRVRTMRRADRRAAPRHAARWTMPLSRMRHWRAIARS